MIRAPGVPGHLIGFERGRLSVKNCLRAARGFDHFNTLSVVIAGLVPAISIRWA
jgi:hypothetical protein